MRCLVRVGTALLVPLLVADPGAAQEETLWLYADGDPFYSLSHSQANFAAFRAAGGRGTFTELEAPPNPFGGHALFAYPDVWASAMDAYLKRRGLP